MKKYRYILLALAFIFSVTMLVNAGVNDRFSDIDLEEDNYIEGPEITAPGAPVDGRWRIYSVADVPYFISDGQVAISMISASTAYDDIGDPDANSSIDFTTYTNTWTGAQTAGDGYNFKNTGAFGDISVMRVEQVTGAATDGTVLEVVAADANVDPLVVSASTTARALVVGQNTGVVTIAGVAEGTTALEVALGDIKITDGDIHVDAGDALFDEDVTVGGWLNLTGDLVGGTGLINYTNFDVDAAGNVSAVDGAFSGNVSVTGTFQQDALSASTADTTITLDGTGTGGVGIGTAAGTGAITLGGSATLVNLPATVDMTLSGGDFAVTDTANADMVTFTNNTMTTADLLTLAAGGTRTSNNVVSIADSATTATTVGVVANAQTSGNGISYSNSGAGLTGAGLYIAITDGAGFTGDYITGYDGAADDFAFKRYGALTIAGNASTDMITVTTGDVQIDDGLLEINTDEDDTSKVERAQATVTGPVFSVIEQTDPGADNQAALFVDMDGTDAGSQAVLIDTEGAVGLAFSALIAAGDGIKFDVANSYTGQGIVADLGPWLGTTSEGFVNIESDSGAVNEVGQAIRVNLQGTGTAGTAVEGKAFHAESQAAIKAGESLVYLDTLTNTALHIDNEGTAADGIKIDVANTYTGQGIVADMGTWTGTTNEGFIHMTSDNAATVQAGSFVHLQSLATGQHAAAIDGSMLYVEDDAVAPGGGTSYAVVIDATNIEALHAVAGDVVVADNITANGNVTGDGASEMVGFIRDIVDGAAGTPITVTVAMSGTIFTNSQATEFDLPAAATGLEYTFVVNNASNLHVDPDNADNFSYIGCAAGDRLLSATVGDSITVVGIAAGTWAIKAVVAGDGDWTDTVWTDAN